ncbi:MAG TPA: prolyl oligopeptidase family serine peptidase [Gemmatimonadaceae bacterium]|nr:prolyl oligopeptidase family serine peptidase [Gemmatimonadaceae bacterium]
MKLRMRSVAPMMFVVAVAVAAAPGGVRAQAAPASASTTDPFLWLEDVSSPRATAWVKAENEKTLAVLEHDQRYPALYAEAVKLAEAPDRIPYPTIIGGQYYNFWQDASHEHGIWRRTTPASYATASPVWTTVLDLDALSKAEHANWYWKGANCAEPAERRCLVSLSDGGEDAVTIREFDLRTSTFVKGGFDLPHGKQDVAWQDSNTVLVAREWTPGEMTKSGYPFVVKRLARGQPLSAAVEVFRGAATDVSAGPGTLDDGDGHHMVFVVRAPSFFETETLLSTPKGFERLAIPLKSSIEALVAGQLVIKLDTTWAPRGSGTFPAGALVSVSLAAATANPGQLAPALIVAPGPRESINEVATTRDALVVTQLDNVRGRAVVYTARSGAWTRTPLPMPDNLAIDIVDADLHSTTALLSVTGFLTPSAVWSVNAQSRAVAVIKSLPAKFDASRDTVEQFEAASTDGTKIPYFVVHPRAMKRDGNNPTILYAYGGFQVSETPSYSANIGKLWLERGGVWVLANIRGGGEFGPAWHEAGLNTHRQIVYDDFAAVGRDLVTRGITSPRRLGIEGGSNGGLLMGVEFTQHPELWNAVDMQVPLLDMLRYEQIAAGASWVGEYGSVSVPAQRAFLAKISPYNNLHTGVKYPEPFVWTTTKDDRVGPQHARKFAAKLASMHIPYLFYEVTEGGHGSGANLNERAHTTALEMTYFTRQLMN